MKAKSVVKKPISKTVSRPPSAFTQASPHEKIAKDRKPRRMPLNIGRTRQVPRPLLSANSCGRPPESSAKLIAKFRLGSMAVSADPGPRHRDARRLYRRSLARALTSIGARPKSRENAGGRKHGEPRFHRGDRLRVLFPQPPELVERPEAGRRRPRGGLRRRPGKGEGRRRSLRRAALVHRRGGDVRQGKARPRRHHHPHGHAPRARRARLPPQGAGDRAEAIRAGLGGLRRDRRGGGESRALPRRPRELPLPDAACRR